MSKARYLDEDGWLLLDILAHQEDIEPIEKALFDAGSIGVITLDGSNPQTGVDFQDSKINLKAYFPLSFDSDKIKATLKEFSIQLEVKIEPKENWIEKFVKDLKIIKIDPNFLVVPSFLESELDQESLSENKIVLKIDPENAFGTGTHETTQCCLTNIAHIFSNKAQKCLDIGTGSGILAIALKKMGALDVVACDIDDEAIVTAQKNTEINEESINFFVCQENQSYGNEKYDLIVANILLNPLLDLAPSIYNAVKKSGFVIVSGILCTQKKELIEAYKHYGFALIKELDQNDWSSVIFTKE